MPIDESKTLDVARIERFRSEIEAGMKLIMPFHLDTGFVAFESNFLAIVREELVNLASTEERRAFMREFEEIIWTKVFDATLYTDDTSHLASYASTHAVQKFIRELLLDSAAAERNARHVVLGLASYVPGTRKSIDHVLWKPSRSL